MFYFEWPSGVDFSVVAVKSFDLLNPVADFVVSESGDIWVSVDPTWSTNSGAVTVSTVTDQRRIRQLLWKNNAVSV